MFFSTALAFLFLISFGVSPTNASDELSQTPYVEVNCRYDLRTAVQVCDCENRDEVMQQPNVFSIDWIRNALVFPLQRRSLSPS